jgi:predicted lipoprotein with Yx(FWY)xxD motif
MSALSVLNTRPTSSATAVNTSAGGTPRATRVATRRSAACSSRSRLFEKDQPDQSACSGACVAAWPIDQSSGTPKAGNGVKTNLLGTIHRSDGTTQVTYNHHPLYYYSGDSGAGQQNGQGVVGFGAAWYVVNLDGGAVKGV